MAEEAIGVPRSRSPALGPGMLHQERRWDTGRATGIYRRCEQAVPGCGSALGPPSYPPSSRSVPCAFSLTTKL